MIDKLRKLAASKIKPMPHQERVAIKFSEQTKPGGGLIVDHDVGTGKTMTSILAAQRTGKPLVAIVPAALRENYRKELAASGYEGDATVVSYHEAMRMAKDPEFRDKVSGSVVVYDEAHRMGSPGSRMSQLPSKLKSHKNLLLTGTTMRNDPSELAPLLRATGKPVSEKEFRKQFTAEEYAERGFLARMMGAPKRRIGTKAIKAQEFRKLVDDVIDTHQKTQEHMPSVTSEHIDVPMSGAQVRAYDAIMDGNPGLAYKLRNGLPPDRKDFAKYRSFLTGLRQVSNTAEEFGSKVKPEDARKIMEAANHVERHAAELPDYRGYSYSNYVGSGVAPLQKELERRGITTAVFDGTLNDEQRKQIVNDYNSGKIQHLLLTSAAAEGLDLKGTRLVQMLDPHWNHAKMHQVKARGIRHKSHAHLPEEHRNVHVQHFFSVRPQHPVHKMLGMKPQKSADRHIHDMATDKAKLTDQFTALIRKQD